ncbi:Trm112 family protein [Thermodesulfobacterium hydrogeniphilum]|uniref:Trm112 family protein n=1 Tax=Thermodesulfobacterium hydrogeniphilum TaxID=161156 RepID=UPI00056E77A6|nr:Trm112 family protein [Thermodesulfobacterium hydrogeniphilum]
MEKDRIDEFLKVLACPKCKGDLEYKTWDGKQGFYCKKCQLFYPIVDDIPVMLIEEAENVKLD